MSEIDPTNPVVAVVSDTQVSAFGTVFDFDLDGDGVLSKEEKDNLEIVLADPSLANFNLYGKEVITEEPIDENANSAEVVQGNIGQQIKDHLNTRPELKDYPDIYTNQATLTAYNADLDLWSQNLYFLNATFRAHAEMVQATLKVGKEVAQAFQHV